MSDLDRRCYRQLRDLAQRIRRIESICERCKSSTRKARLMEARNSAVIQLHEMGWTHKRYDQRLSEAMDDPTGQDLDAFQFSE
jgi:hypothetical protein